MQALTTVFIKDLAGSPGEDSPIFFPSVPCCVFEVLWTVSAILDAGLDAVFELLAWAYLLSMAFKDLTMKKLSTDSGLIHALDMPRLLELGFRDHYLDAGALSSLENCVKLDKYPLLFTVV